MKPIYIYIISIFLLFGCSEDKKIQPSTDLGKYILDLPEVEVSKKDVDIDREQVNSLLSRIDNSIPDRIFLIDYSDWSIFMAKKDGTLLDKKGGQGRGPGEFLGINDLYTYTGENILQVFDKKMKRITYYNIKKDSLEFGYSINLPNYDQYYLQTVFKSNGNTVGIFRVLRQHGSKKVENKIYAYYLDSELRKKEKILEIDGTELIEVERFNGKKRFEENSFGNKTVWSYNDGKLVFANAGNLNFKIFDFDDNSISEFKITDIPENRNTSQITELWSKRYKKIFSLTPEYETYFKEREYLPYFTSVDVKNEFIYIPLKNYGQEKSYILRFNTETKLVERIETPQNFYMKGVNRTGIYGTIAEQDYYSKTSISILEFK